MLELEHYISTYFGVADNAVAELSTHFRQETLVKGAYHTKMGSYRSNLSFIRQGFVRVHALQGGKEVTQWIGSPGEFATDLGTLVFAQPARFNIEAITDCELFTLSMEDYQDLGSQIAEWKDLEKLFLSKCFMTLEQRVFSFISLSAEERYRMLYEYKREIFNQVPQQYIASMLGMTPETFSRIRSKITS